jgi:hypothetical protein
MLVGTHHETLSRVLGKDCHDDLSVIVLVGVEEHHMTL